MPLSDIDGIMTVSESAIRAVVADDLKECVPQLIGTLKYLLETLATKNAVYCGIGRHVSIDGQPATSWLTISSLNYGAAQNPRLVVRELAQSRLSEEIPWVVEPIDIAGRPALLSESIRTYPAPDIPAARAEGDNVSPFQIEVLLPSEDGTSIAAVELSTASVSHGPEYRSMVLAMAASLEFRASDSGSGSLDL
ncbi:hypothetical protein AB0B25_08470 [Nocardia sp. NPDC049190]|uniref:hypothetical protein n=1 Tax=Nocardia sp. NPDC049190 TaxID=3155650 RepID=UPI0033C78E18